MFDRHRPNHRRRSTILRMEHLEERATPALMTPTSIRHAYGFDLLGNINGTALNGAGQTIAIVDAYYDKNAQNDLNTFDAMYGLSAPPTYTQVSQTGGSPTGLATDPGWAGETALDIEWAHAIAPGANILLVEANDSGGGNLDTAVDYARKQAGVSVVSMSWGSGESSGEANSNSHFTTPSGHAGVSFFAASGDNGGVVIYPSASPNVVSVGGTSLTLTGGNYGSESAWSAGGGGASQFVSKPSYQTAYSGTMRGTPDVSYDADPQTGFSVYNTTDGGWEQVGGTSAASPQWAALVAIADQGRALEGQTTLDGPSQLLPAIYALPATDFNDVTTGSNGNPATAGYDLATGRGTPKAQLLIPDLISYGATHAPTVTTQPVNVSVTAGATATFTAAASGSPIPTVQWQISTDGGVTFTNILGATFSSYTTPATVATDGGDEFRAVFSNGVGSPATTTAATLTVVSAPSVTQQPIGQTVTFGQTATFSAVASGSPTPTIQWQVRVSGGSFTNISGATGATYSFTPALSDNGDQFRAVFTNSGGSVNTFPAPLTVVAPISVASIEVGDGTAERSEVRSITVTFSGAVTFAGGDAAAAAAFQLTHVQTGNNVTLGSAVSTNAQGQTVVTLTFSGTETDAISGQGGALLSLADGRYALTINSASVLDANGAAIDGDGDGVAGGNYVSPTDTLGGGAGQLQLYRLFGDVNGNGVVDQLDLGQFRSSFNAASGNPLYLSFLDADNSGAVDQLDLGQFRTRFNLNVF